MFKRKKPTLLQFVIVNILLVSLIFLGLFYLLWVRYEKQRFRRAIEEAKAIYLESKKESLKTIVEQFYLHLNYQSIHEKEIILNEIKIIVNSIEYFPSIKELKQFCFNLKKKNETIDFVCLRGNNVLFSSNDNLDLFKSGEQDCIILQKIKIKRLNAELKFVVFKEKFNNFLKRKLLNIFKDISFNYSGYLFIVDSKGTILLSAHRLMKVKIADMSNDFGSETQRIILDKALNKGGGFVEYTWFKPDLKTVSRKISYLKYDKNLKWIFGAGIYLDDIDRSFAPIYADIKNNFESDITRISILMAIILFLDLGLLLNILRTKFRSDFVRIGNLLDNFEHLSEKEINGFQCKSLTFVETCSFASKVKSNLLEIKKAHRVLMEMNRQLKEVGEKFRALAEQIGNVVVIINRDFFIEFVNREFYSIFEIKQQTVEGENFLGFFPVELRRNILKEIEDVLSGVKQGAEIKVNLLVNEKVKHILIHLSVLEINDEKKILCTMVDTTEKEILLERLKFLTEQYEKAEEMAKVGNWIYYPETKKFWASKESFRIYEIEITHDNTMPANLINSKIHKDDVAVALQTTLQPLKYGKPFEGSFRLVPSEGKIKYVISKSEPIFDESGKVVRVEGVLKDVTDLKKVELELQRHIKILEKTQLLSRLGYWEYDFDNREFYLQSSFFAKVLKKTKVSLDEFLSFVIDRDRDYVMDIVKKGFPMPGTLNGTFRIILPEYNVVAYVYFDSDSIEEIDGKKKRVGWLQDITHIKQLEEEIEAEREKLARTINSLNEGVALLNKKLNFVFVNESFVKIFKQGVSGGNLIDFLNSLNLKNLPEDLCLENFEDYFFRGLKCNLVFDNAEIVLNLTANSLKKSGSFEGYVLIVDDITSKEKYTEEVIKTQNMRLINKIAASLAHDLNNLLGSILGKISILEKEAANTRMEKDLARVMRNINIARTLATQFLAFSKSGKPLFVNIEKATISQIITDLSEFVFSGSSIEVDINIEKNLWLVKGDKIQVAQIILNLLSNARSVLGDKGKVEVKVENCKEPKPLNYCKKGQYVLIKVADNGPGIPEEKLQSIFEFFVGYKKEGFGLGLAIVKSIVDAHGGCLNVQSEEGKGAIFYVYLPAVVSEKAGKIPESVSQIKEKPSLKEDMVSLEGLRIAVLEDELPMQETIFDLMDYLQVKGDIFSKGEELIEAIKKNVKTPDRYNVALLDLTIKGGLGGKEVIGIVKDIDPEIIAFVSSGYSKDPIVANYQDYGFDGALPKPYSLEEFENALKLAAKKIKGT